MKTLSSVLSLVLVPLLVAEPLWPQSAAAAILQIRATVVDGTAVAPGSPSAGISVEVTDEAGAAVPDAAVVVRLPDSGPTGSFADGSHAAVSYTDESGKAQIAGLIWGGVPGAVAVEITATKGSAHSGTILEERIGTPEPVIPASPAPQLPASSALAPLLAAPVKASPPKAIEVTQPGPTEQAARLSPPPSAATAGPSISVVNAPTHEKFSTGSSHGKWIILAVVVAAGAGAGIAMAGKKSSASSTTTSGVTIGGPTVSVGAP